MSGMLGGYSFPVLHPPARFAGFGQDPVTPTHNAVRLVHYTAGVPPLHDTPPATSGDPFSVVQLAAEVAMPAIQTDPKAALAQAKAWASEPWMRINDNAYIATPPERLRAVPWVFGTPEGQNVWAREFELTMGVQFGPQPALAAYVSEHEAKAASAAIVLSTWLAEAPGLPALGPAALDDPTFRQALVDLQNLAWLLRQCKRLRGLSLERRLLKTGSGSDWAWIFADESGAAWGWSAGWVRHIRAVLAPPAALVNAQLAPLAGRADDLEQRLQAARVAAGRPPTPILPPGTFGYVPTALVVAAVAFGAWWIFQRRRVGRGGGGGGGGDTGVAGIDDVLRDVTPTAKVAGSESFLSPAVFD